MSAGREGLNLNAIQSPNGGFRPMHYTLGAWMSHKWLQVIGKTFEEVGHGSELHGHSQPLFWCRLPHVPKLPHSCEETSEKSPEVSYVLGRLWSWRAIMGRWIRHQSDGPFRATHSQHWTFALQVDSAGTRWASEISQSRNSQVGIVAHPDWYWLVRWN